MGSRLLLGCLLKIYIEEHYFKKKYLTGFEKKQRSLHSQPVVSGKDTLECGQVSYALAINVF